MFRGETGETTYAVRPTTFLSRFCAIQWRSARWERDAHTADLWHRLAPKRYLRLSFKESKHRARPFSAFNCIEKSPGSRKSISNERRNGKKGGEKKNYRRWWRRRRDPLETESGIVFFPFFFFFAHGVSIIDN